MTRHCSVTCSESRGRPWQGLGPRLQHLLAKVSKDPWHSSRPGRSPGKGSGVSARREEGQAQLGDVVVPYLGQEQFTHSGAEASGEPPVPAKDVMLGKVTGKLSRGTGTGPQAGQWTMGIGVPQYRCLEISQSFSLSLVTCPPTLFLRAFSVTARNASCRLMPVN